MAITVTATQGGSTANGMALRVFVLTGAKTAGQQAAGAAAVNSLFSGATSFTQSITTTAGSNVYGASSRSGPTQASTGSNATIVDDIQDSTNSERYVTFKALNVTGAATTRGYTTTPAATGPGAMQEFLAATTLAEDSSAPAVASTTAATAVTTGSFTPPQGSLLVAAVSSDGGAGTTTMTVSDSSGLAWTEGAHNNTSGGDYAGIWFADVPGVGFDAAGPAGSPSAGVTGTTSPLSWTHVLSSNATAILVGVVNANSNTDNVTSVTIGASNTNVPLIGVAHNASGVFTSWFGLLNPPTGSQTVKVNFSGSPSDMLAGSVSFVNAASFGSLFSASSGASLTSSQTVSVTSTTAGGMVAVTGSFGGQAWSAFTTTGSGGTIRVSDPNSSTFAGDMQAIGTYPSTGSAMTVGLSAGLGSDLWTVGAVEVLPALPALTGQGLLDASPGAPPPGEFSPGYLVQAAPELLKTPWISVPRKSWR